MSIRLENGLVLESRHISVLQEHLPYEIDMLDACVQFLANSSCSDSDFTKNVMIECFFLHARNLLDFFLRMSMDQNAVAAMHFTKDKVYYEFPCNLLGRINEQISHLKYERADAGQARLSVTDVEVTKQFLDVAIKRFQSNLCSQLTGSWQTRQPKVVCFLYEAEPSATNVISIASSESTVILDK